MKWAYKDDQAMKDPKELLEIKNAKVWIDPSKQHYAEVEIEIKGDAENAWILLDGIRELIKDINAARRES